jgi:hypothetical protein
MILNETLQVINVATGEVEDSFEVGITNQAFLRGRIIDTLHEMGGIDYELSLEDLNKWIWCYHSDEIKERKIEWTWQHLIASARKWCVDNDVITRDVVDGVTYYQLTERFREEEEYIDEYH